MNSIIIKDIDHIREAAREFIARIGDHRVFAFYGKMGAGKTTFVKAICEELGVDDVITSPTFAIINEYTLASAPSTLTSDVIYHFDFYRLKNLDEAYDIGYEEYFYSGDWVFTEWTEKIEELLPEHYVRVEIEEKNKVRILTANIIND
jgi:tRNA threonylcarbamoyladenosine biosynthesis protein TsaE